MSAWTCLDLYKLDTLPSYDVTSTTQRREALSKIAKFSETGEFTRSDFTSVAPQPWHHQFLLLSFFFLGMLGTVFYMPLGLLYLGFTASWATFGASVACVAFLVFTPLVYCPASNFSFLAKWLIRYTSYRIVWEGSVEDLTDFPVFGLVPPHGVFPLQNILVHLIMPSITGM
jgi:hypothetical protein